MAPAQIGFQQGCRNVSGVGVKTDVLCIQPVGRQRAVLRGELDAVCAEVILDEQVCGCLLYTSSPRRCKDRRKADGAYRSHHPVYDPEGER